MKKRMLLAAIMSVLMVSVFGFMACSPKEPENPTTSIAISKQSIELFVYQDELLTVTDQDGNAINSGVEWTTADDEVATVSNGSVLAVGAGETTVKAAYSGAEASCLVKVTAGTGVPVVSAGSLTNIEILNGGSYNLSPALTYLGKTYNDAVFSYAVTEGSDYISVNAEGVISSIAVGAGKVTVTAVWRGAPAQHLTTTLDVTVKFNASIETAAQEYKLYSADPENTGLKIQDTIALTVIRDGEEQTAPDIVWDFYVDPITEVDYDNGVITLNNGVITSVKSGISKVTATYSYDGNIVTTSPITITVEHTVLDKTDLIFKDIDTDGDSTFIWNDYNNIFDGLDITKIIDKQSGKQLSITQDASGIIITKDSAVITGERVWQIYNESFAYEISATVATKIITTGAELLALQTSYGNTADESNNYTYDGYFILGNHINFEAATTFGAPHIVFGGYKVFDAHKPGYNVGFQGIFDGRGYCISGITFTEGGLFGNVGGKGVVKNLGFVSARFSGTVTHLMAFSIFGTVDNIYVDTHNSNLNGNPSGTLSHAIGGNAMVSNIVISVEGVVAANYGALTYWYRVDLAAGQAPTVSNAYVISSVTNIKMLINDSEGVLDKFDAALIARAELDISAFSGFDTDIWDLSGSMPVFINAMSNVIDKTQTVSKDIDTFSTGDTFVWSGTDGIFDSAQAITSIIDKYNGNEITFTYNGGNVVITKDANLVIGERVWRITGANASTVDITAIVATKVITTGAELLAMQTSYGNNATADNVWLYDGYFVLGNDIAFTAGTAFGAGNILFNSAANHIDPYKANNFTTIGFQGTFDGRGHTISGITFNEGGLFGIIGSKALVKNIAFDNVKIAKGPNDVASAHVLASGVCGTVTNIYINYNNNNENPNPSASVCFGMIASGHMSNVVVSVEGVKTTGFLAIYSSWRPTTYTPQVVNCYVVTSIAGVTAGTNGDITKILRADLDIELFSGFDTKLWDLSGNMPVLKAQS